MSQVVAESISDIVRTHVRKNYLNRAIQTRQQTLSVNVGEVHKALELSNRVPLVCAALKSQKFLDENGLRLVSQTGPPSGQSTRVTFTYEILTTNQKSSSLEHPLINLRGIAKDVFQELGGGEAFIRNERNSFTKK